MIIAVFVLVLTAYHEGIEIGRTVVFDFEDQTQCEEKMQVLLKGDTTSKAVCIPKDDLEQYLKVKHDEARITDDE